MFATQAGQSLGRGSETERTMRRMVLLLLVALLTTLGCKDDQPRKRPEEAATSSPVAASRPGLEHGPPRLDLLLPEGTIDADIMDVDFPPRAGELAARLQQALQRDPLWWAERVKQARVGEPVPYHAKMGLTKAEYEEFLKLSQTKGVLVKRGSGKFTVRSKAGGLLALDGAGGLASLSGVEVDPNSTKLITPFGTCVRAEPRRGSQMLTLGPWDGYYWELEEVPNAETTGDGLWLRFHLGRLRKSGRGMIYYKVTRIRGDQVDTKIRLTITYSLPAR